MSSTYTTSTGSVSFTAVAESWSEPATSEVNVIGFPGGDAIAVSIAGQRETTRAFKALFSTAVQYRTFRDMRGKTGTLFVEQWDTVPINAILKSTSPDPIYTDGSVLAQAQFVLY